jgi:hypothetical protein
MSASSPSRELCYWCLPWSTGRALTQPSRCPTTDTAMPEMHQAEHPAPMPRRATGISWKLQEIQQRARQFGGRRIRDSFGHETEFRRAAAAAAAAWVHGSSVVIQWWRSGYNSWARTGPRDLLRCGCLGPWRSLTACATHSRLWNPGQCQCKRQYDAQQHEPMYVSLSPSPVVVTPSLYCTEQLS